MRYDLQVRFGCRLFSCSVCASPFSTSSSSSSFSSSSALSFTRELPLRTVNCSRHEDALRSHSPIREGRARARASKRNANPLAPRRAKPKMMARIRQRVRCSFHRRFAERGCRSLRAAARCAGHASDTGQNSTGPAFEKVNNGKHDILY